MKKSLFVIFAILPEISIYVFIAVCVMMVHREGGPYRYLYAMIPIFIVNTIAIAVVLRGRLK